MTYPISKGSDDHEKLMGCRLLQYPNLDILYEACDLAGVSCSHIMIYRDPYKVLRSTVDKRHYEGKHQQIVTLTEMLHILQSQMESHPHRLAACWDFDEAAKSAFPVALLFGWDQMIKFTNFYQPLERLL